MYAPATRPCACEDGGGEQRRRGLAVGADDVDRAERPLRLAERREQQPHALEPEPHAERGAGREQVLEPGHLPRQLGEARLEGLDLAVEPRRRARAPRPPRPPARGRRTPRWRASPAPSPGRRAPRRGAARACRGARRRAPRRRPARGRRRPRPARRRRSRRRSSPGRDRPARSLCARRCAASSPPETASSSGSRGPRPASWRMRRSSVTSSITADTARAASAILGARRRPGTADCISSPRSPGRYGQISSVTNGITGCSSAEHALEHEQRRLRRLAPRLEIVAVEPDLERLEVPVADVVPDEAVQLLDEVRELERLVLLRRGPRHLVQPRQDPAVDRLGAGRAPRRRRDRRPAAPAATRSTACS